MIRGLFRLMGVLILATGFVFLIYDGARSIADRAVRLTRSGDVWNEISQSGLGAVRAQLAEVSPMLWQAVDTVIIQQPVWAVLGVLGLLLLVLFRRPRPLIGYARR